VTGSAVELSMTSPHLALDWLTREPV
jgi:hypothetical protein